MKKRKIMTKIEPIKIKEFKGEESVIEWENNIEDVLLEMSLSKDKRSLLILSDIDGLRDLFYEYIKIIRDNMNNDIGDPCTLIQRRD